MLASPNIISNANYAQFALPKLAQYVSKPWADNKRICLCASSGVCGWMVWGFVTALGKSELNSPWLKDHLRSAVLSIPWAF